jgi:DNA polymerase III subunit alpha
MVEALDVMLEHAASFQREKKEGQFNLFAAECVPGTESSVPESRIPDVPEWDDSTKLNHEKLAMGFYLTGHPLVNYEDLIRRYVNAFADKLGALADSSTVKMAGLVKKIKEINTKKGERMAFIALEDLTGVTEVTIFSDLYSQCRDLLKSGEPLIVSGIREGDKDSPKVLAQEIYRMEEAPRRFSRGMQIRISTLGADPHQIRDLKRILARHRGRLPVKLHVVIPNRTETIINLNAVSCDPSEDLLTEVHGALGYQAVSFE